MWSWVLIAVAAVAGFYAGKNAATVQSVYTNRDKIEGANEVVTGLGKIFG